MMLDAIDRALINRLQDGVALHPSPFDGIAAELSITVDDLLRRLQCLKEAGAITRFGPFFDAAAMGGAFCLCAMNVPAARFEEVCGRVNAFPEVAHNYQREHSLNMWFVLATEDAVAITETADAIERATGLPVMRFPKLREFFIGFRVAA
ncbi:Lrp/AsnC family transcriptional regulator [Sedimentitalea sp. XS_ASV28]|uniref:Lrp/AsnC family transcriptional regulator n=1 Tax=Sedimentitalea sp. XS_ASV28 TaxID=3241296 RepID=UPI003512F144